MQKISQLGFIFKTITIKPNSCCYCCDGGDNTPAKSKPILIGTAGAVVAVNTAQKNPLKLPQYPPIINVFVPPGRGQDNPLIISITV